MWQTSSSGTQSELKQTINSASKYYLNQVWLSFRKSHVWNSQMLGNVIFSPSVEKETDYYYSNNFPRAFEPCSASLLSPLCLPAFTLMHFLSLSQMPVYVFFTIHLCISPFLPLFSQFLLFFSLFTLT